MTTPPKYTQLTDKIPGLFHSQTRTARVLGRARMVYLDSYHIIPTVETWPWSTDFNGQSYPAGTVGVRVAWTPGQDGSTETRASASQFALIPVPSHLPAGYTPRLVREFFYLPGSGSPAFGQAGFSPGFSPLPPYYGPTDQVSHQIRLADGLHDYWASIPESRGRDGYSGFLGSDAWSDCATAGLRYIQMPVGAELRCYADGHKGSSPSDMGDTLLLTGTGSIQAGPTFGLGVKKFLRYPAGNILAGPRVDLPLQFLTSGNGMVVPGGYVAAKLDVELPT